MKKAILFLAFTSVLLSCNNEADKTAAKVLKEEAGITVNDEETKIGEFSFDDKKVKGEVSTQYFGSDKEKSNFSVLCQHDDGRPGEAGYELLQITFLTRKDAASGVDFKIYDGGSILPMTDPIPGVVTVSLKGIGSNLGKLEFTGTGKSAGTIRVKNDVVEINNLLLFNRDGEKRTVNAKIPF
ncbi:hypothetical protein HHL16_22895 [Pseudoflavitalea sp. G-6-1-2]|uniref:hypothetical protein n=1 Tax=Pseudoflavitalea sp. G-6-1-2 TaxID=2728841 RepID=UPI00146BDACE|nr:hypothetical protein [Pseudoflavitalea sp. G-6-1-2]NML23747.1 hypothetical protein [Pseudoflavitalea sp. G-6-1-2]